MARVKSVNDILNMDISTFRSLKEPELRRYVSTLSSAANKRLTRLEGRGHYSPAQEAAMESGGRFSVRGKNMQALQREYTRAKNFLQMETSSVRGNESTRREVMRLLEPMGVDISNESYDEIFKTYNKLKKLDKTVTQRKWKYLVLEEISKRDQNLSVEERAVKMYERFKELYEQEKLQELEYRRSQDVSGFFEQ